jgi:hypothetical protein
MGDGGAAAPAVVPRVARASWAAGAWKGAKGGRDREGGREGGRGSYTRFNN